MDFSKINFINKNLNIFQKLFKKELVMKQHQILLMEQQKLLGCSGFILWSKLKEVTIKNNNYKF